MSPAPTPDYSLKFPVNRPMSHLLHLDILFPLNMRCTYANNAEEHNNDNSDDKDNSDGHWLSSIKY